MSLKERGKRKAESPKRTKRGRRRLSCTVRCTVGLSTPFSGCVPAPAARQLTDQSRLCLKLAGAGSVQSACEPTTPKRGGPYGPGHTKPNPGLVLAFTANSQAREGPRGLRWFAAQESFTLPKYSLWLSLRNEKKKKIQVPSAAAFLPSAPTARCGINFFSMCALCSCLPAPPPVCSLFPDWAGAI